MDNTQEQPELDPRVPAIELLKKLPKMLAGERLDLAAAPRMLVERDDIVSAYFEGGDRAQTFARVAAAALILHWPRARKRDGCPPYRGDILRFGGECMEFLLRRGATRSEILRAGDVCVALCVESVTAQEQALKGAADFSGADEARASSSSSASSANGTATPGGSPPSTPSGLHS